MPLLKYQSNHYLYH